MARCGDAVALMLNGVRYKIPKDTEPTVIKGGKHNSESQEYGDGTSDPVKSIAVSKITGLKITVDEENKDDFDNAKALDSMPVILECVSKSYECTGYIVGTPEVSATKRTTGDFEIHVGDGSGIRES